MTTSNLPHPQTYEAYRQARRSGLSHADAYWSAYMISPETEHGPIDADVTAAQQQYEAEQPQRGGA